MGSLQSKRKKQKKTNKLYDIPSGQAAVLEAMHSFNKVAEYGWS